MQEPVLFDSPIRENILYGLKIDDEENMTPEQKKKLDTQIYIAAMMANALQFIEQEKDDIDLDLQEQTIKIREDINKILAEDGYEDSKLKELAMHSDQALLSLIKAVLSHSDDKFHKIMKD